VKNGPRHSGVEDSEIDKNLPRNALAPGAGTCAVTNNLRLVTSNRRK